MEPTNSGRVDHWSQCVESRYVSSGSETDILTIHQKKLTTYIDQSRIRSEQGRMKFMCLHLFAFFTCFYPFSTVLIRFFTF